MFVSYEPSDSVAAFPTNYAIPANLELVGPTGIEIASNWTTFVIGTLTSSVATALNSTTAHWTGSTNAGTPSLVDCTAWTVTSGANGLVDNPTATSSWIDLTPRACSTTQGVLCVCLGAV